MNWDETIQLLHEGDWKGRKLSFDRMRALLSKLGSPEQKLRFLHIAGTNGKGSTSAMLASVLSAAGYRTGLYISPHIREINERWSIDGVPISDARLKQEIERLTPILQDMEELPTSFELLTVLGFCYFYAERCDFVVLEVGLGGRIDSTNVIPTPECAAIMNIGLEHTEILGDTLEKIAWEKGGIIKEQGDVVLYPQSEAVETVIREIAAEKGARLFLPEEVLPVKQGNVLEEGLQYFDYGPWKKLALPLLGAYQRKNAAVALAVIAQLQRKGFEIPEEAVRRGLREVNWPGRFELLSRTPRVLVDGAHNPNGVEALIENLQALAEEIGEALEGKVDFLVGVLQDKDYHTMLRIAAPYARSFLAVMPPDERALSQEALLQEVRQYFSGPVHAFPDIPAGLRFGMAQGSEQGGMLVCFGSLYQVSEIREFFEKK